MTRAEIEVLKVTIRTLRKALREQGTEQEAQDDYDLISAGALLLLDHQIPDENRAPVYPAVLYK